MLPGRRHGTATESGASRPAALLAGYQTASLLHAAALRAWLYGLGFTDGALRSRLRQRDSAASRQPGNHASGVQFSHPLRCLLAGNESVVGIIVFPLAVTPGQQDIL